LTDAVFKFTEAAMVLVRGIARAILERGIVYATICTRNINVNQEMCVTALTVFGSNPPRLYAWDIHACLPIEKRYTSSQLD
jgi:hypothetical protein